jgi:hypothetical protein
MFRTLKRFLTNKQGNFAMVSILAFPMLFAGVALSVDVTNGLRMQADLQNANDTAVMFSARYFQVEKKVPSKTEVQAFLSANYSAEAKVISIEHDTKNAEFILKSELTTKPLLMGFFNNGQQRREVLSKAKLGVGGILEFALALDTTWSMNFENRLPGLKAAGAAFVNMLMDVKDRGATVRGGIVPFARYVNVGISRRNEPWMDVEKDSDTRKYETKCTTKTRNVSCLASKQVCWGASVINHPAQPKVCWNEDGQQVCSGPFAAWTETKPAGCKNECTKWKTETYQDCKTKLVSGELREWKGCVGSRDAPWNAKDDFQGKKFPGLMNQTCSPELLPLTDSRSALLAKIDGLWPQDNTYIPEGIMWGMRLLTAEQPFTEASGPSSNNAQSQTHLNRKALIIMTDGMNTIQASGKWHNDTSDSTVSDALTLAACAEAKRVGLEVYTVSFGNQVPVAVRTMLDTCASKASNNFHATTNDALVVAFKDIADQLLSIRLSQ